MITRIFNFLCVYYVGVSQAEALKEENDSLRCQLDAYRNEVELLKQEQGKNQPIRSEEDNTHSQQLSFLQQALQGMQKVMLIVYTDAYRHTILSNSGFNLLLVPVCTGYFVPTRSLRLTC